MNGIIFKKLLIVKCFDKMVESNMKTIPIKNLMPTRDNPGLLFKEFIEAGINPVGNDYNFQKSKDGKGELNWYDIFNLENGQFNNDKIQGPEGSELYSKLQKNLVNKYAMFYLVGINLLLKRWLKVIFLFQKMQLEVEFLKT